MGLFDHWLKADHNPLSSGASEAVLAEQDATRLLEDGIELEKQGQIDMALRCYDLAIERMPELARAHFNRGNILLDRGDVAGSLASYLKTIEFKPDSAAAHYNLGNAQISLGNPNAGITALQKAITLKPDFIDAHHQLGIAYYDIGKLDEAVFSFGQAIAIDAGLAIIHNNLGNAFKDLERFDEAISSYQRALQIDPQLAAIHNNLGLAYREATRFDESVENYQQAIRMEPDFANAYANLGVALKDSGRLDESIKTLEQALEIDPNCVTAHNNLLFISNYLDEQTAERMLTDAKRFGDMTSRVAQPYTEWENLPDPERPLRIGFVSGDLCSHSVGFFLDSVLNALAKQSGERLELFAYPTRMREDETSKRLRASFDHWHPVVGLSDTAMSECIRDDGIDILIDLSGHTAHNRLLAFSRKPAPIQVSWLGYCATTGISEIDYFLADEIALPDWMESQFTESIWRLPECYICLSRPTSDIQASAPPALKAGYLTFGSFNNIAKMNDKTICLWARILQSVPGSKLLLKAKQLDSNEVINTTLARYAKYGIAGDRLILEGHTTDRNNHLLAYNRVDIALDPFPYNGVTTTAEALWMGVPVLTLSGERFLSRQGVDLLMNAGLSDWIASSPDDYVNRAANCAGDLNRLEDLRSQLRQKVLASPIFDAQRFAGHFEEALRGMWQKWCAQRNGHCT